MLFIIIASGLDPRPASAQPGDPSYFPETGHLVTGEFLNAYYNVPDPLSVYGYPITEAYQDITTGRLIQYFQKARFELHTEAPPELRVQLTPLGRFTYEAGQAVPVPSNFPACQVFPETGFQVCYTFLEFFNLHGGVAQFGYPISNFELRNGVIVQYFQRVRMEWRPGRPPGERVVLTDLGTEYFYAHGENPSRLLPVIDARIPQAILDLQVHAYPLHAVTGFTGEQTVFVVVQDQNRQPVAKANISLVVHLPTGEAMNLLVPTPTDANGITQFSFKFSSPLQGSVQIDVQAAYEGLKQTTATSFRTWW